jgi:hypothetical protein
MSLEARCIAVSAVRLAVTGVCSRSFVLKQRMEGDARSSPDAFVVVRLPDLSSVYHGRNAGCMVERIAIRLAIRTTSRWCEA